MLFIMNQVFVIIRICLSTLKSETIKVCFSVDSANHYLDNLIPDGDFVCIMTSVAIKEEIDDF